MKKTFVLTGSFALIGLVIFAAACGSSGTGGVSTADAGKTIRSAPAGNGLTATISSADGTLKKGKQDFTLTFTDASGKTVDVGSVALNYHMPGMGSMAEMNNAATFRTTGAPGVYKGNAEIEMAGEWQAQITYEGPAGKGSFSFPVNAK